MNKALIREFDHDVRHCPFCGSLGQTVGRVTLDAWLKPEFRGHRKSVRQSNPTR